MSMWTDAGERNDEAIASTIADLKAERDRLLEENKALREDAMRYRWLRDNFMHIFCANDDTEEGNFTCDAYDVPDSLDAAIDAALAKVSQ